jgi:hypothetical protein
MLQGNDVNRELTLGKLYAGFVIRTVTASPNVYLVGEIGLAGMGAGFVMSFFNCPVELLKVKLQTQSAAGVMGANGQLEPAVSCCMEHCF